MKDSLLNKNCLGCNIGFHVTPSQIKRGKGKYCSRVCQYLKAGTSYNCNVCGMKRRVVGKAKLRKYCSQKCFFIYNSGDNHPNWVGDNIGYAGVHDWIESKQGRPKLCDKCGTMTSKRFEWSNISGEYLRDLADWWRLCKPCHVKYDDVLAKGWKTRRAIK